MPTANGDIATRMARPTDGDLGFSFVIRKSGEASILRRGRIVTVLRGRAALDFGARIAGLSPSAQQQFMARATGNYKRGNERPGT
jgi:hypothetical protein